MEKWIEELIEELIVKAIRQFKREHPNAEIKNYTVLDYCGSHGRPTEILLYIIFVEESGGAYKGVKFYFKN